MLTPFILPFILGKGHNKGLSSGLWFLFHFKGTEYNLRVIRRSDTMGLLPGLNFERLLANGHE